MKGRTSLRANRCETPLANPIAKRHVARRLSERTLLRRCKPNCHTNVRNACRTARAANRPGFHRNPCRACHSAAHAFRRSLRPSILAALHRATRLTLPSAAAISRSALMSSFVMCLVIVSSDEIVNRPSPNCANTRNDGAIADE